jgi:hypothetical protein
MTLLQRLTASDDVIAPPVRSRHIGIASPRFQILFTCVFPR